MARTSDSGKSVPTNSLDRALVILESVAKARRGLTNKDLSTELGIATSSCSYILGRLESHGFLSRDPDTSRYSIGLKAVAIARGALRPLDFRKLADPVLRRLSEHTGLETVIGVLEHGQLMVLNRISNGKFPGADVDMGTEFPPHTTAMGKLLMAHLPSHEVLDMIEKTGLPPSTDKSIGSKEKLLHELDAVREQGYALTDEEHKLGLRSVGVPITDPWGKIDAALAAIGTVKDLVWQRNLNETLRALRDAAREISALRRFGRSAY